MKKRRLKKSVKIFLAVFSILLFLIFCLIIIYNINLGKVNNKKEQKDFIVSKGSTYSTIANNLKEEHLIKSVFFYKVYVKLHNLKPLKEGKYELNTSMNVKKLLKTLENETKNSYIKMTFKEGINFRDITKVIGNKTKYNDEEVYTLLKDSSYLDSLIKKYWFITEDIKNEKIYYSLEGYLFPDTYHINEKSDLKGIFKDMLDNMEKKLEPFKSDIKKSEYSIHEILTMASIVELEASNSDDRAGVAGVFYNRLKSGWSLGSDVTTYYGLKLSLSDRDLTADELNEVNSYNTRSSKMAGILPVSPICIPSIESIKAAINPSDHNYFYFVADKTGKTYFSKTSGEHNKTIAKLKKDGKWFEY